MHGRRLYRFVLKAAIVGAAGFALGIAALVWDGLHDEIRPADLGVVLGNTVYPDGTLSPRLAARLDRALELRAEGVFQLVLVSGAIGKEGRDEALAMRDYLLQRGVPSGDIVVDSNGVSTYATAANAQRLMQQRGLHSAVVISQYFHVPRARLALRRFGVEKVYSAHARYFELRDLYSAPRELIGFLRYALRSYDVLPPKA